MNTGTIASRYATALLKLTTETGRSEQVCFQIVQMMRNPDVVPENLEPDLVKFFDLLTKRGRLDYLKFIFYAYIIRYFAASGTKYLQLTTAAPSKELEEKVVAMIEKQTGSRVLMESKVDPSIIGGFILEVDDKRLDASVRRQIELLRNQLVVKNNRLV